MEKLKYKLVAFPLTVILVASAISPCFAAGDPSSGPANTAAATAPAIIEQAVLDGASSDLIPIERSENNINGEMVITEVFEVDASLDPNTLIKDNFELNGYLYSENSIVKTPFMERKEKDVSMVFSDATDTEDMGVNIKKLPFSMAYNVDGYVGELFLNPQTVTITATEQETRSSTKREVKTYNLEMNDPSLVPQSYNGLPLKNLSWAPSGYIEDSSIPSGYIATATYSRTSSWKEDSAWNLTATYEGTAVYENTTNVRYTITYKGAEIPKGHGVINGQIVKVPNGYEIIDNELVRTSILPGAPQVIGTILVLALIAFIILFLLWAFKHGLIASRKIVVQAQDDASGEYRIIQKAKVNKKAPAFELDTLQAPSSRHFLCEMSARQAFTLRGKVISITADGQVYRHQVQPQNDKDKYIFPIDLETVEAGPIDPYAM